MAELLRKKINDDALFAIWQITESIDELRSAIKLNEDEEALYRSFVAEIRKKQWLAYRLLVRELIKPADIPLIYDPSGKPILTGSDLHISVSHTEDLAAVIISRKARVGIDIEKIKPRIIKVKEKFLNDLELSSIKKENQLEQLTLAWCAKEALYKLYGQRNLDFKDNILVEIPNHAGIEFDAWISTGGKEVKYHMISEKSNKFILVYSLEALL